MKKKEFEIKAKDKIVATNMIYKIRCSECISYEQMNRLTNQGLLDGNEKEFLSINRANDLIVSHTTQHPLHKPYLVGPIREYMVYDKHLTMKYRVYGEKGQEYIHIYSVDGFEISPGKHVYACMACGALYQSKDSHGRSMFPTDDPRCLHETHRMSSLSERLCLCPTFWEEEKELEDIEHEKGCVTCHRKVEADKDGLADISMYSIHRNVDKPDKRADNPANMYCICGMCYCKETGDHNWMSRTNPKTGRSVNVFCMSCKMKTRHFDKIAKRDRTLRRVKNLWSPKRILKNKNV